MTEIKEYLDKIDAVIAEGRFKDDWQSLSAFEMPSWYRKGRFGLFIHWGAYSVPATENEWYPRQMYIKGTRSYHHRLRHYGAKCDYRQIVEKFKPKKFDAREWLALFKESGAKYIMPVAEHHDGVKMYGSDLNRWNMVELNGRDYIAELHAACDEVEMGFLCSSHRAEHYWFLNGARKNFPDSEITRGDHSDLYGPAVLPLSGNPADQDSLTVSKDWLEDWLASSCEMIDKNQPLAVYFDWWIVMKDFKPYIKKFLAYYYNRAQEWGKEVGVFYKTGSIMKGCAIFDVERGQIDGISQDLWQNDTAIAKNSWGYTDNNKFKSAGDIARNMIDVVSKNGCFMLNVGPKSDGTICKEEAAVLINLGKWLEVNGEAIYDSFPYEIYGESKRKSAMGTFKENLKYHCKDVRFTYKTGCIYIFPMGEKLPQKLILKTLRLSGENGIKYNIKKASILGYHNNVGVAHDAKALTLTIDGEIRSEMPLCIKLEVD